MEKDVEQSQPQFDIENFTTTLQDTVDTLELWLIESDLRQNGAHSSSDILRLIKQSCDMGYMGRPKATLLAEAVDCSPPLIVKIWNGPQYQKKEIKETRLLTPSQEEALLARVLYIIDTTGFIIAIEIRAEASRIAGKNVGHSWHIGFLDRNDEAIGTIQTDKREETRMKVSKEDVPYYESVLENENKNIPAELFVNADEVGYQQLSDTRRRSIIVRKKDINKYLHNPVDRSETRVSITQCAALSSDSLIPFVIVKKPLRIQEHHIAETRDGIDAILVESEGTTMTGSLFCNWPHSDCVPFADKQRQKLGLDIRTSAVLQIDNCRSHLTADALQICALNNIKMITLPPNSTQFLQPLDLGIFESFKQYQQTLRRHNMHDTTEKVINIAVSALQQALAPDNVIKSFAEGCITRKVTND
ncbi:MAG: hypothetical protein EZS28_018545 [Streblomastix strix]|uniref:DDE-1 domain-containing protein n=1 Tax=Streblomastix strix TaxID=222440 RepID=A0A5J4VU14_9EUKA|nr:MAG: hypothetical protein EZS28_018545 [Streblomastix strix]